MPNYRRLHTPGGTDCYTFVTYRRRGILIEPECREILREVINKVRGEHPFAIAAWVLLPDHLHCIWRLPAGDSDYSKRWGLIKAGFSKQARPLLHRNAWMTESKKKHRERTIWQRRFWEHEIRDEVDYRRHVDYLHYNPVKHGLVNRVGDWPYSTFHRHVYEGSYPTDWGGSGVERGTGFGEWCEDQ